MILLIGCGNSLRRDDGAGLLLAALLEKSWRSGPQVVKRICVHQLTPDLAEYIARDEVKVVVFVDSIAAKMEVTHPEVEVRRLTVEDSSPSLGHFLPPKALMLYARFLYNKSPSSWTVTVPGTDYGHGEGLGKVAKRAIGKVSYRDITAPDVWLVKMAAAATQQPM